MTLDEIINKLTLEMFLIDEDADNFSLHRTIIQRAVVAGMEHFTPKMDEIIAMDIKGNEIGRYRNAYDAAAKLGVAHGNIQAILSGKRHSIHGYMFVKSKIWIN